MSCIKIYWYLKSSYDKTISATNFVDYLRQRLATSYTVELNSIHPHYTFVNHNEYELNMYFKCLYEYSQYNAVGNILFIEEESESDVKITLIDGQTIILTNTKTNQPLKFGIEHDIPMPYLTGIYTSTNSATANLSFNYHREYLLTYVGGSWRGPLDHMGHSKRGVSIAKFIELSEKNEGCTKYNLFYCPVLAKTHSDEETLGWSQGRISMKAKEAYAQSIFSWHPEGDTPTRRAFYEALLMGNIPVISYRSYMIYRNLLIGDDNVRKIAIIINDANYFDPEYVLNILLNISESEISERRNNIIKVCDRLQWGFATEENALTDILKAVTKD